MKRLFVFWGLFFIGLVSVMAQSQYISYERVEGQDRIDDDGRTGVWITSKRPDLVVSVLNPEINGNPRGRDRNGNYTYELLVDPNVSKMPKIEVSKRGDINRCRFTVNLKKGMLLAYHISEVEKPIVLDDITAGNEVSLSMDSAVIEIVSSYSDLQCDFSPDLHARMARTLKNGDKDVHVIVITIPIANVRNMVSKLAELKAKSERLESDAENSQGKKKGEILDEWDRCEAEIEELNEKWLAMKNIIVYGTNTNRLAISVESIKPESKFTYGILAVKPEVVTEAGSFLSEGARLFDMRRYPDAKISFNKAINAKDFPKDMLGVVNANIAECDSCIKYTAYGNAMLKQYLDWKKQGEVISQKQLVICATAALEMFQYLSNHNPCDYYSNGINKLKQEIDKVPFDVKFTVVKWQSDYAGLQETGPMGAVEIWGYYGKDKKAMSYVTKDGDLYKRIRKSSDFKELGTTGPDGVVDIHLTRSDLPSGFFFRPIGYENKAKVKYIDMSNVMAQSQGDYTKRQFRLRMFVKK